jgi:ribonuclease P protein component
MIKSTHRFHGRSSLRFVYQRGQAVRGGQVSLRYAFNSRRTEYRVAVVVSRKVSKSAVVRNRVRRRVYEVIRKNASRITSPYDLVFTVYNEDVARMSHANLQRMILGLLERAGVMSRTSGTGADRGILDEKENSV